MRQGRVVWLAWARSYERARQQVAADDSGAAKVEVARVIWHHAALRGTHPEDLLADVLERYWRQPWPRAHKNRASLRNLLSQLPSILDDPDEQAPPDESDPPDYDPARHGPPRDPAHYGAWNAYLDQQAGR